ncbi:SWIB/MDM2 domain containing protein, partial [Rhypophila sp. PSN 637]
KQYLLSKPLASLVGVDGLSRPQVVKEIWKHVKSHGLQDPSDKRYINCDATMQAVFKTDRVHMFTMNKLLSEHLQEKVHDTDEY